MSINANSLSSAIKLACVTVAWLLATACGSSRGNEAIAIPPSPQAGNEASMAQANQRLFAAAATEPVAATAVAEAPDEYRLGAEDRVSIVVFGAETFSGDFAVDESGAIAIPLLGPVPAANHTPREMEDELEARLRETYMRDPHVTVSVLEMKSHGVSVMGAVNAPGVHQVSGRTTVLDVLAKAEGLSDAAGNRITVTRPTGDNIEIDLSKLLWGETTDSNVEVRAGDIVHVHNASLVYVVGEVNNPGGFTMPLGEQMTVLQALAMAQGKTSLAADWNSTIVRTRPDGSQEEIPVDVSKVLDGEVAPPAMEAADVLYVPRNGVKAAAIGVANAFVRMVTFRGLIY